MSEAPQEAAAAPPLGRDVWAWIAALSVTPLALATRGATHGEAVAEDFDFIRRAMEPGVSLLDGGGSLAFWRPLSHQLYYESLGSLILSHPGMVAALHAALLGLAALLLYGALRRAWPRPLAAAAAAFPLMAESSRTLILWPSHFVDLGAFLFLALAYHQAAARRVITASLAMLAALLCKELALVGALLLPFAPGVGTPRRENRTRVLAGMGLAVVVWALAYAWVRRHAGLELPHGIERDPALLRTSMATRLAWAVWNSLRATWSLPLERSHFVTATLAAVGAGAAALAIARVPAMRARWSSVRGAVTWGLAWAALSWAALASIFPLWASNRSQLGSVGFGVAALGAAHAIHPLLPAGITVARLALLAASPGAPSRITPEPVDRGAFLDYQKLCRLQRLMRATRHTLKQRFATMPRGSAIGVYSLPLSTEYAFGGPHALQAWYHDTTLGWVSIDTFEVHRDLPVLAFLDYEPRRDPQVVLLDGEAVRAALAGFDLYREGRWAESLAALERAAALQRDPHAMVFRGDLAGRRASCRMWLGAWNEAEREAAFALAVAPEDVGARYVMALAHARRREWRQTRAELDTLLATDPRHEEGLRLQQALDSLQVARR